MCPFLEVSTVLTFCYIVVAIVAVIVFTLAFSSKSMYITTCSTTFFTTSILKNYALLSVVSHPSHMLLYFSRVRSAVASWSISSLALCSLTPIEM